MARRGKGRRLGGSFWPSEQQRLLLRACFLPEGEAREIWGDLHDELDIERLEFGSMALLPLLYERLGSWGDEPPERLKGVYRYVWYRNQIAVTSLTEVVRTLNQRRVDAIVLGPGALVLAYYGRLGVRPFERAEVLIRPDHQERAVDVLAEAGWSSADGADTRRLLRLSGTRRTCVVTDVLPGWLDAVGVETLPEAVWRERARVNVQGVRTHVPSATHELLFTIVQGARTGGSAVQWIADAMEILDSGPVDWDALCEAAVAGRCVPGLHDGLVYLADELAAPVPNDVVRRLTESSVTRRERVAHWIGGRGAMMGNLPRHVEMHLVSTQHESIPRALYSLPSRLEREWGVDSGARLMVAAARKTMSALARATRGRRHEPLYGSTTSDTGV